MLWKIHRYLVCRNLVGRRRVSMNKILLEDITNIANSKMVAWDKLEGKSIFVTGATGLIGSQIVFGIDQHNKLYGTNIKTYALARNPEKAAKLFGECSENVITVVGDMCSPYSIEGDVDYIVHGASMTSSKDFVEKAVETILTGINSTANILNFAREKKVSGFVYLSSLEAYGVTDPNLKSVKETDYGFIDQLSPRSSYSEGKRMAECLCASYASEYGVPAKIVRLCQTFGAGVDYSDNRVFAQFAKSAIEGKDIILKTKGETYRNYCYTSDAVTGILCALLDGNVAEAYNIANPATGISIADMAKLVADKLSDGKIKVCFDIAEDVTKLGYGPTIKVALDTTKLEALGWKASVDLEETFRRTIEYMKDTK